MTTNKKGPIVAKTKPTLIETLANKANELDASAATAGAQSKALAQQAAEAAPVAETATAHAIAVDQALGILTDAGVSV